MMVYKDDQEEIQVKAQQWYKLLRCTQGSLLRSTQGRLWGEVREVWGMLPTDRIMFDLTWSKAAQPTTGCLKCGGTDRR
jgi:hypothetical protein